MGGSRIRFGVGKMKVSSDFLWYEMCIDWLEVPPPPHVFSHGRDSELRPISDLELI
jgi:hypothetical protein